MLEVNNLEKKLGSFWLHDISFRLPKGYIMGLIGPNGAGKTSLIKILLGLYQYRGNVVFEGEDFIQGETSIKAKMGFVLNEEWFCGRYSPEDNADFYGMFYPGYDKKQFMEYLGDFGLSEKKKLKHLSKGERLKFQFAFALSHNPKLLILDEPLANFDPQFREKFFKMIKEFIRDGERSVLIASHLVEELEQYADYITYMEKGTVVFSQDMIGFLEQYQMITGDKRGIDYIRKSDIIYRQDKEYFSKVMVKKREGMIFDKDFKVEPPTLEEAVYFFMKGRERDK